MPRQRSWADLLWPLVLALAIIALDQLTKLWVVANIPRGTIFAAWGGDLLRIIHVRNLGAAFSLGGNATGIMRGLFFLALPTALMAAMIAYHFLGKDVPRFHRWAGAGIVGGGVGNLIDRYLRPEGVVDFIDVKFFGLLGLERWPTFNVADSAVVVCGILLAIHLSFFSPAPGAAGQSSPPAKGKKAKGKV